MNKHIKIILVVLVVFVILFICINPVIDLVITNINNLNKVAKVKYNNLSDFKRNNVYYYIEEFDIYGNLAKYLHYRGWSFVETERDSNSRIVELVLYNENEQYIIHPNLHERETFRAFPDKKIDGKKHGFYGNASLIKVNDGNYNLYIRDVENEDNYGLIDTGRVINKYGNNACIYEINKLNSCINTLNVINDGKIEYYIEKMYNRDKKINILGWAYLKNINKTGQIYIGIKDKVGNEKYYAVKRSSRPDVVKHFNNADLLNSGFEANIMVNEVANWEISSILIEYNRKYYKQNLEGLGEKVLVSK